MLGKRSCILRTTSSRSLLIPCEDSDGESMTSCNYPQVTEKSSGPTLCSPCKVVIGFDVEAEKKPPVDVCESPRSVLESSAALSPQEKQQVVARSPRSGLGSLLATKGGSEENVGSGIESIVHAPASMVSAVDKSKQCNQITRSPSKATAWPAKIVDFDPMDDDICASQGQGVHLNPQNDMEDDFLDSDISPLRVGRSYTHMSQDMNSNLNNANTPKAMNCVCLSNSGEGGLGKCKEHKQVLANPSKNVGSSTMVPYAVNAFDKQSASGRMHAPGSTQLPNTLHLCKGEGCVVASEEQIWNQLNFNNQEVGNHQSIFSASSPPPCPRTGARVSPGFLKVCSLCGRSLRLGKDIFMYRGDQPFCSAECRYQRIVLDESKDKRGG